MKSVAIEEFMKMMNLKLLYDGERSQIIFKTREVNRIGLQLTGFFDFFPPDHIQLFGLTEMSYMEQKRSVEERVAVFEHLMSYEIPCIIICHDVPCPPELMRAAHKWHRPVFFSPLNTSEVSNFAVNYLSRILAPRILTHGVLMEINGLGVLITGESGIGKSETALELIHRGHLLVADDAVEIYRSLGGRLIGEAPQTTRYFIELRGLGILNVRELYGVGRIRRAKALDMVIELERWDSTRTYDRIGLRNDTIEMLDVVLPRSIIPIMPGRNLAIILEIAARNVQVKTMGYDPIHELQQRIESSWDDWED